MTYFYPVLSTEAGLGAVTPISTPILSASGFSQVERSKVGRSAILVNGKQLAAVCRIKPLRRLHCCALPVLCWGGAGVPGIGAAIQTVTRSTRRRGRASWYRLYRRIPPSIVVIEKISLVDSMPQSLRTGGAVEP